jgi:uncharacterized protein YecE (DUF72 family)
VIRVGTSGWQYRDWTGPLYPEGLAQHRWLAHFAERFATVEVNSTFYRLPEASTFAAWGRAVPDGFCFAVKASRFLTHVRRLRDPAEPVERLVTRARALGEHLGPVLLQLPPDMPVATDRLGETLDVWPSDVRLAVELRHPSWFTDDVLDLLHRHGAALVLTDRHSRLLEPRPEATASWGYVRLHEGRARPWPRYGDAALRSWVDRIGERWGDGRRADVWVYFNNDPGAAAIADARRFSQLARRAGLEVGALPSVADDNHAGDEAPTASRGGAEGRPATMRSLASARS